MLQRQVEIYTDGAAGKKPDQPVGYDRLREMAKEEMSEEAFAYVDCGAGGESTMRANVDAFERWRILPRMLSGVVQPDLNVELFGRRYEFPFLLAPIGALSIVHPDAETAVAGAAAQEGVGFVLSTVSSRPLDRGSRLGCKGYATLVPALLGDGGSAIFSRIVDELRDKDDSAKFRILKIVRALSE